MTASEVLCKYQHMHNLQLTSEAQVSKYFQCKNKQVVMICHLANLIQISFQLPFKNFELSVGDVLSQIGQTDHSSSADWHQRCYVRIG